VAVLVPYPRDTTPSQRFRFEQWGRELSSMGIHLDLYPFADAGLMSVLHRRGRVGRKSTAILRACARRWALMSRLRSYDAVVVHRSACLAGPALIERLLARHHPLIFDFDDAIYLLHTTVANRAVGWLKFPGKTATICRKSAQVVVGNPQLAAWARQHNPNVAVVWSSVDTEAFSPAAKSSNRPLVVGWTGSSTSLTHLEAFADVLAEVTSAGVELRVHSDREPRLPGVPFVYRPWRRDTENAEISAFDIGIMPMPDNSWSRGKGAMKALLYMAVGIPAVCSDVGANSDVIRNGETGFLIRERTEWTSVLRRLAADPGLRRRIGMAGRREVETRFSCHRSAADYASVIRETLARVRAER
jgi:glycosyltransferase involved in cell wall biosynthesis